MRMEHPTLDGLSSARFAAEVEIAAAMVAVAPDDSRELALSFGLRPA